MCMALSARGGKNIDVTLNCDVSFVAIVGGAEGTNLDDPEDEAIDAEASLRASLSTFSNTESRAHVESSRRPMTTSA